MMMPSSHLVNNTSSMHLQSLQSTLLVWSYLPLPGHFSNILCTPQGICILCSRHRNPPVSSSYRVTPSAQMSTFSSQALMSRACTWPLVTSSTAGSATICSTAYTAVSAHQETRDDYTLPAGQQAHPRQVINLQQNTMGRDHNDGSWVLDRKLMPRPWSCHALRLRRQTGRCCSPLI